MKTRQVPGAVVPSDDEQRRMLAEKLSNHEDFARLRHGQHNDLIVWIEKLIEQVDSPTQFLTEFDGLVKSARVIGDIFAQMWRDDHRTATYELRRALLEKGFLLTGETVSPDKLRPVTILIFDLIQTLAVAKWVVCGWSDKEWQELTDRKKEPNDTAFDRLLQIFPELDRTRGSQNLGDGQMDNAFMVAALYKASALNPYLENVARLKQTIKCWPLTFMQNINLYNRVKFGQTNWPVFGLLLEADQDEVLKVFSRDDQADLSTWRCEIPKTFDLSDIGVGLYLENDQSLWHRIGICQSSGFSGGYGAAVMSQQVWFDISHYFEQKESGPYHRFILKDGVGFPLVFSTRPPTDHSRW